MTGSSTFVEWRSGYAPGRAVITMSLDDVDRALLHRVDVSAERLETSLRDTRESLQRKIVRASTAVAIAVLAALLAIFVGYRSLEVARRVDREADGRAAENVTARIAACVQFNSQRAETRAAMKLSLASLLPAGQTVTEAQQKALDTYNGAVDDGLPFRDCSPSGIDAYFKFPPKDPGAH